MESMPEFLADVSRGSSVSMHNFLIHDINRRTAVEQTYIGRVLDLGCGTAAYKEIILRTADEYIGVDWENSLHEQSCVDVRADLTKPLPFADDYADVAVSFQVMEHLPEPAAFLSESFRVLKPGGKIILTTPFMWGIHEAPYDYFRYTRYGLEYLLAGAGFVDISVQESTGFWQTFVLKFNYHTTKFARGPLTLALIPIWWLGQKIAPILDRYDRHPEEAASYTSIAVKPPADNTTKTTNSPG